MALNTSSLLTQLYQQLKELDLLDQSMTREMGTFKSLVQLPCNSSVELQTMANRQCEKQQLGKQMLEEMRSQLRKTASTLSKQSLRSLRIINLPDEVLVTIFENLIVGWDDLFDFLDAPGIRNVRLSCRRLCSVSSHLLIPTLSVDFRSLSRLEEISRHPFISKGVRMVRVSLSFHGSALASDILSFTRHNLKWLKKDLRLMEQYLRDQSWGNLVEEIESKDYRKWIQTALPSTLLQRYRKTTQIVEAWNRFLDGVDCVSDVESDYRKLLQTAHEEYQKLFAAQERLREDDTFIQAVATAFAKMPRAKSLSVVPLNISRWYEKFAWFKESDDNMMCQAITENMLLPLEGGMDRRYDHLGDPPTEILAKIPIAISKAGVSLTSFYLYISWTKNLSNQAFTDEYLQNLTTAMQKVCKFKITVFNPGRSNRSSRARADSRSLQKMLGAMLNTASIESLYFHLTRLQNSTLSPFSFANLRQWTKVSALHLNYINIRLSELHQLFDQRATKVETLYMDCVYLADGTWAEALDVMRGKVESACISNLCGHEFDDAHKYTEPETAWAAVLYITGEIHQNPFVILPSDDDANEQEEASESSA